MPIETTPISSSLIDLVKGKRVTTNNSNRNNQPNKHSIRHPKLKQLQHTRIDGFHISRHMNRDRKRLLSASNGRIYLGANAKTEDEDCVYEEELTSITHVEQVSERSER